MNSKTQPDVAFQSASAILVCLCLLTSFAYSQSAYSQSQQTAVAAKVNETVITWKSIRSDIARTIGDRNRTEARRKRLEQAALATRIRQAIAFEFLKERHLTADESSILVEIESLKSELAKVEKTLQQKLEQSGQTKPELEFQLNWRLSWKKYLDKKLTSDFLKEHYKRNQRRFDGTELRVAHLLLKHASEPTSESLATTLSKAKMIRDKIEYKETDWKSATSQFSDAPTKKTEGEIGWITSSGPMPMPFTSAAFRLEANEISEPTTTRFGVHLIKCLEVKKGTFGWRDAIDAVKKDAERELLDAIVADQRSKVKIEIPARQ